MTTPTEVYGLDFEYIADERPAPDPVCLQLGGRCTSPLYASIAELAAKYPTKVLARVGPGRFAHNEGVLVWSCIITSNELMSHALDLILTEAEAGATIVTHAGCNDWGVAMVHLDNGINLLSRLADLIEAGRISDTEVRERLWHIANGTWQFDPDTNLKPGETGFPLSFAAFSALKTKELYGAKKKKDQKPGSAAWWRIRYHLLLHVPVNEWPAKAVDYALEDPLWARDVWFARSKPYSFPQGPVVREDGSFVNEREQVAAALVLHIMSMNGPVTDPQRVKAFTDRVTSMWASSKQSGFKGRFLRINGCTKCDGLGIVYDESWLHERGICEKCNGVVNKDHKKYGSKHTKRMAALVDKAYAGTAPRTPTGRISMGAEDVLVPSGDPLLREFGLGAQYEKLVTTYVPQLAKASESGLRSRPNVLVRTGRTSWTKPNLQNPPRVAGFRDSFMARPGQVFASIDYSCLETCTLAQTTYEMFGRSRMRDVLNEGRDIHLWFANLTYLPKRGIEMSYEEVSDLYKNDKSNPLYKQIKADRQAAKASIFGFPGGAGIKLFIEMSKAQYGVDFTVMQATAAKKAYTTAFPEMADYFAFISDQSDRAPGPRFRLAAPHTGRIRGDCTYTSGCNYFFQGRAADGAKLAMWKLFRACYLEPESPLYGVRMWGFIHDEFLFEGPEETAHIWAEEASRLMVEGMQTLVPDVLVQAEPALMPYWYKDAEPVYVDGKLVPWTPDGPR